MPGDLLRALFDPTAPLPAVWPGGGWGAFLLFLVPIGGGIPLGILMARQAGLSIVAVVLMYLGSDLLSALVVEPFVAATRRLGPKRPAIRRLGERLSRLTQGAGLQGSGAWGPLGLVLLCFSVVPLAGRA